MTDPIKAVAPQSIANPVIEAGQLTCTVGWAPGNQAPLAALLFPVIPGPAHTSVVVKRDGTPFSAADTVDDATVDRRRATLVTAGSSAQVTCAWPGQAQQAVLLLIHPQIFDVGSFLGPTSRIDLPPAQGAGVPGPAGAMPGLLFHMGPALPATTSDEDAAATAYLRQSPAALDDGVITPRVPVGAVSHRSTEAQASLATATAFALASCQYPATLIDRGIFQPWWGDGGDSTLGPAERSLAALADQLGADATIGFTVLAGDQVYVDATAGLFDPANLIDQFKFAYQAMNANKGFERLSKTPNHKLLAVLDDHEIADNWEPATPHGPDALQRKADLGIKNYLDEEGKRWPEPSRSVTRHLWEQRMVGGWNFFFADTRTARMGRWVGNWRTATILDPRQEAAFLRWIGDPLAVDGVKQLERPDAPADANPAPRFVVSPSILLPRLLSLRDHPTMALQADSWCGYPASLHRVLARLYEARARGVVFLSGDEHLSCAARIEITRNDSDAVLRTHSVHSSALYAPYPFANSRQEDFIVDDVFEFDDPFQPADDAGPARVYRCAVATTFPELGDGFAILRPAATDAGWQVDVAFHRPGEAPDRQTLEL